MVRQARAIRRVDQRHHVPIAIKHQETVRGGSAVAAHCQQSANALGKIPNAPVISCLATYQVHR